MAIAAIAVMASSCTRVVKPTIVEHTVYDTCVTSHMEYQFAPINLCAGGISGYQKAIDSFLVYDTCITSRVITVTAFGETDSVIFSDNGNTPGEVIPTSDPTNATYHDRESNHLWGSIWPLIIAALALALLYHWFSGVRQQNLDSEQNRRRAEQDMRHAGESHYESLRSSEIANNEREEALRAQRAKAEESEKQAATDRRVNAIMRVMEKAQKDGSDDGVSFKEGNMKIVIVSNAHPGTGKKKTKKGKKDKKDNK